VITAEDAVRREAVAQYGLVGRPPEPDLESLVRLAATVCGVSTAVINIIDDRFQHQVAAVGLEPATCSREDSMCAIVLHQASHVLVPDARQDERFADNPFVTGEIARVRFYASSPLVTPAGIAIGTLCVFDEEVGDLVPAHSSALDALAHQVVDVLELRRITRQLEESNEQLALFASQVSHDLRNPLMALTGFIELAADDPEMAHAPHAAKSLARAESAADRMAAMITHLLDFARTSGRNPRLERLDLAQIVRAVAEDLDAALTGSDAVVELVDGGEVVGDPTLVRVLLQNVVANAVKFSAAAGVAPRVEIRAESAAGGSRITVDDNGPGIPPEQRERVFELMERGSAERVEGLGIGLSTCRRIADAHGGRIDIEDSPLGGARVSLFLPDAATGHSLEKTQIVA
jgi:signal transduction histidine kinase